MRVAVLVSGQGSNLAALIAAEKEHRLGAELVAVASDRADAPALDLARAAGIPVLLSKLPRRGDRRAFDDSLFAELDRLRPDLYVLAGFMRILDACVVAPRQDRMINLHPSLLPKHPGLATHARVLDEGDSEHGASVHYVIPDLDAGPVLMQTRIAVGPWDTAASLAARLKPLEHRLLVASVVLIASGRVTVQQGRLRLDGALLTEPLSFKP